MAIVNQASFYIAFATLVIVFFILFNRSGEILSSFFAALLTACLAWIAYVLVRMIIAVFIPNK